MNQDGPVESEATEGAALEPTPAPDPAVPVDPKPRRRSRSVLPLLLLLAAGLPRDGGPR